MSKLIYLKNFNNYFNRKIKFYNSLSDYPTDENRVVFSDKNFNPNDGVAGSDVVNWSYKDSSDKFKVYDWTPDYCLVVEEEEVPDRPLEKTDVIKSRWFVTEFVRTRAGQYQVTLRRDITADNYSELINAPIFVEKGMLTDITNPLLYNKEGMQLNQIKTSETLIKDRSRCAWVVGYISSKYDGNQTVIDNPNLYTIEHLVLSKAQGSIQLADPEVTVEELYCVCNNQTIYGVQGNPPATQPNKTVYWLWVPATGRVMYWIFNTDWQEGNPPVKIGIKYRAYSNVQSKNYSLSIPGASQRNHLQDAPYDMFAIPFGTPTVINAGATFVVDKDAALEVAMEIAKDIGKDNVYDIQLLPYCPMQEVIHATVDGQLDMANFNGLIDYTIIYGDNSKSICLWCKKSTDTLSLSGYDMTVVRPTTDDVYDNPDYIDYKVSNECDLYRFVSPNFNGQFDMSVAKNGGSLGNIIVDFTYKPQTPYIHVQPTFKFLYNGQDGEGHPQFGDCRGLICGGDFSLPILADAYTDYQVQNKNFQNIFDRQIQNMDTTNELKNERDTFNAVVGSVAGIGLGAAKGASGGVGGAIMGGVSGAAGVLIAANTIRTNKELQQETRQFSIDNFNMSLQNIQALPYSLTKISAFNANNKIFPMIEYYTCTDREKEAFLNKIKYDGMTVGVITTINDFIPSVGEAYVKGQLIRCDSLSEDTHMLNCIYEELSKGVYLVSHETQTEE